MGLIAALPLPLAQHLRLTFTRIGWHGWGSLVVRLRGWQVLGLALKLGWLALSRRWDRVLRATRGDPRQK